MKIKYKKIGVFTSGGDSPGMNAAIRAVVRTARSYGIKVYGIRKGYEGMIDNDMEELHSKDVGGIIQRGGTILNSDRSKRFRTLEGRQTAFNNLRNRDIEAIIAIGGDGTFTGASIFHDEFKMSVIGIPGTIDNDIYGSDFTIGYDTALNTVVQAIDKIQDTAGSHNRLFFVEVMGRDAGFIALNAGIATGAEDILIPETITYLDDLILNLKENKRRGKTSAIIIVAEGDDAGGAYEVAAKVKKLDNSYSTRVSVLGHIQRGGSPSAMDRVLASSLGYEAVTGLIKGYENHMVGIMNNKTVYTPLEQAIKTPHNIDKQKLQIARMLAI
ncbi:MAG: 6-phosphofructokinase [Bacteroidetes bacterium CG2_30_33_31]|nr:MAG: 6-phosphofructokinase [Bacteroidetes bacterium CG2_30_33_31]